MCSLAMPRIMTHCPTTETLVPTGHRTPALDLEHLEGPRSFRCPACQQVHAWTRDEASIEQTISLAALRNRAA